MKSQQSRYFNIQTEIKEDVRNLLSTSVIDDEKLEPSELQSEIDRVYRLLLDVVQHSVENEGKK